MLTRQREPELMDAVLDCARHQEALKGLARLNAASGAVDLLWRSLRSFMQENRLTPIKILDLATGGGDVPLALMQLAKTSGVELQIDGCDLSETAIVYASERARQLGLSSTFFCLNVLEEELPANYDVVMNSLFMHHLDDKEAAHLLGKMKRAASQMVLISDLERSLLNLGLVWVASHTLSSSPIVHFDGPTSVRNAYTIAEIKEVAKQAGMQNCVVESKFPCRWLLTWEKSDAKQ